MLTALALFYLVFSSGWTARPANIAEKIIGLVPAARHAKIEIPAMQQ
mgnify:CR=1 FL=1